MAATTLGRFVRPEIQALRAVAVLLVLVYHLWPDTLRGGFVGVDVFFAISGYLITAHLLREVHDTPRALRHGAALECVEDAMRERRPAGLDCAMPRSSALLPDPAAVAAEQESPRVRTVDLSQSFCNARECFPVVAVRSSSRT